MGKDVHGQCRVLRHALAPRVAKRLHAARHASSVCRRARRCLAARAIDPIAAPEIAAIAPKKILVLGGTGRVGSSTATALLQLTPGHAVTICGRAAASHSAALKRRPELAGTDFLAVDIYDFEAVKAAAAGFDLVIHTAGPFQRREDLSPLRACIAAGVPYIDVCDDQGHSELTKTLHEDAVAAGVPCLTTAGIYPGISNVMAAHMCSLARKEYDTEDLSYREPRAGAPQPAVPPVATGAKYSTATETRSRPLQGRARSPAGCCTPTTPPARAARAPRSSRRHSCSWANRRWRTRTASASCCRP